MLTRDRPEMAKRAVECFRSQTYQNKHLLVVDNVSEPDRQGGVVEYYAAPPERYKTIGELRNFANSHAAGADILIHWDDDDWSHPNRISEQVALLQASGKQCVGYRDMLFWRDTVQPEIRANVERLVATFPPEAFPLPEHLQLRPGEAWLYSNADPRYIVGSSLAYWRETWEKRPFRAAPENPEARGEDVWFIMDRDTLGVLNVTSQIPAARTPQMICSIHGRNTTSYAGIEKSGNWKRVPEWDSHCRSIMIP
jgi:glycosyltransferase involved in cell wall biosynthesis